MRKKHIIAVSVLMLCFCFPANAQLSEIGQILKQKAKEKIERTIEDAADKAEEKIKEKIGKKRIPSEQPKGPDVESETIPETIPEESQVDSNTETVSKSAEVAYLKSDFVQGDEIIFDDNFEYEQVGEFPSKWDISDGSAEVAIIGERKVLMFGNDDAEVFPLIKNPQDYLPDMFTIEFDVYFSAREIYGDRFNFSLELLRPGQYFDQKCAVIRLYRYISISEIMWDCLKEDGKTLSGREDIDDIEGAAKYEDWNHIAVSFNKRALKIYLNGIRICNVPNMSAPKYLHFSCSNEKYKYKGISNIRIAKGAVPLYDRLATDGKIITYAINFETGKADILPESYIEINRIARIMKDNADIRFEIQGHCDTSGNDAINEPLSQARAEAIKNALVEMGIDPSRLTAVGKGSREPIASNSTDEGRSKNRRVEFVKLPSPAQPAQ